MYPSTAAYITMDTEGLPTTFKRLALRALRSDFGRDQATAEERSALAGGATPITEPLAQDYAAWRFAVLCLAAVVLVIGALVQLGNFETVSGGMVREAVIAEQQRGNFVDEDIVRQRVEANFGVDNLDLLDLIPIISLLAVLTVAVLAILAMRSWRDVRRSARLARLGWYVLVGTPLLLAILPWSRWLDFNHLAPDNAKAMQSILGVSLGLSFFMTLAPKLISIFPGIIRASVTLKTMLHESPVPGYTVVLFAPVYTMFVLVIFTTINQMQGSITLLVGLACLAVAPMVYLLRARDFLRPHTADESATLVRAVRKQSYLLNLAGTVFLVLFLADLETVSTLQVLEFLLMAGGGVLLMMVVAADLVLGLLRLEHDQARRFVGSELATAFETKLSTLSAASLGNARPDGSSSDDSATA
ncbi:MAG: hypothetical protein ACYTKC_14335 [Planctomycetota bacterium]|jgi:hypothetical protein